nr:MFS transporter [Corynebacterium lactis]
MGRPIEILIGQALVSRIAGAAELVALNWWVYHSTGSSTMVGVVTLARLVPLIVAAPRLGARADRTEPTRLLAAVLGVGAAMTFACAGVMHAGGSVWPVVALVAVRSAVTSAEPAIRNATLARISGREGLMKSMSSLSLALTLSLAIGPGAAGVLMSFGGAALAIAACGLGYAASAVTCLVLPRMRPDAAPAAQSRPSASPWPVAAREVRRSLRLGAQLILAAGPMLCIFPYTAMLPVIAHTVFGGGAQAGIAYLSAAGGLGAVVGAVCLKRLLPPRPGAIAAVSAAALSLPTLALACSGALPAAAGLAAVGAIGLVGQLYRTSNRAATLLLAPEEHRGLFSGISQTDRVLIPAGAFVFGVVADAGGVPAMAVAMAVGNAVLIAPALALMVRQRR